MVFLCRSYINDACCPPTTDPGEHLVSGAELALGQEGAAPLAHQSQT